MRLLLKIFLALILLVVLGYFGAMDRVDYTPHFEADYYQTTTARLQETAQQLALVTGPVAIGLGKVNITPPVSEVALPMAGYGQREGEPATGIHDSLYVKTLAIEVAGQKTILIGADLLIIPPNVTDEVADRLAKTSNLHRDQLWFTATHTHSSMGGWSSNYVGKLFAGEPSTWVVEWLCTKIVEAVQIAHADLQIGQIGFGHFEAPGLVKNRLVGDLGEEDPTCSFIMARQREGKTAIAGFFAAHATTLSDQNMNYSADYPAYWYRKLERAGVDLPIFCAGSVGSHGPEAPGKEFEQAQFLGEALADTLLLYSQKIQWRDTLSMAALNLVVDLPVEQIRLREHWCLTPFLGRKLFPPYGEIRLQSLRFDQFIWTTTPADYSGELALIQQNALARKGFQSAISSFNGAYIGYILPAKYYHLNEYESRTMSWFGPHSGPYLAELISRMNNYLSEL